MKTSTIVYLIILPLFIGFAYFTGVEYGRKQEKQEFSQKIQSGELFCVNKSMIEKYFGGIRL